MRTLIENVYESEFLYNKLEALRHKLDDYETVSSSSSSNSSSTATILNKLNEKPRNERNSFSFSSSDKKAMQRSEFMSQIDEETHTENVDSTKLVSNNRHAQNSASFSFKLDEKLYNSIVLFGCLVVNQFLSTFLLAKIYSFLVSLVIGLASFGASFGLRRMYVKALLKIFEYATNIKEEKIKECEELLPHELHGKDEFERRKELAKLKRLRLESFMLKPPSLKKNESHENFSQNSLSKSAISEDLNEYDKQNNNYLFKQDELVNDRNETDEADDEYKQLNGHVLMDQDSSDEEDDEQRASIDRSFKSDQQLRVAKSTPVKERRLSDMKRDFELSDVVDFVHKGLETIIDDDVTKRFTTEELTVWNLLSRTNQQYEYVSFRVTVLWLLGLILRYVILFPFRLVLFMFACLYTFLSTFLIGLLEDGKFKRWLSWYASIILHRILSRVFSAIITYHDRENRAKTGSICVANHTSPIDVIILSTDNCYSMIGQTHGGFTGMMQRAFSRAARHIWFDRSETRDRGLVARRMREHVQDKNNMPILIFPEGTCINNTSVMMFKKGCFEVDTDIYPVAIKYDLRFGDAFWNSSKHSMLQYLMLMMTSWAIVVDVYYLPPMRREEDEDATQFASRVKSEIVKKGSFVDLNWDGMLKRTAPKLDLMYEQQQKYVSQLKLD